MDQGSNMKQSAAHNFAPTVTKFCVMWEGQALPHDTKFGNSRCEIVGRREIFIWSLIHGLRWSGLIKVGPGLPRIFHVEPRKSSLLALFILWCASLSFCRISSYHWLTGLPWKVWTHHWVKLTWWWVHTFQHEDCGDVISSYVKITWFYKTLNSWTIPFCKSFNKELTFDRSMILYMLTCAIEMMSAYLNFYWLSPLMLKCNIRTKIADKNICCQKKDLSLLILWIIHPYIFIHNISYPMVVSNGDLI